MANLTMPNAPQSYSQPVEQQFRTQVTQVFQAITLPQAIAIYALATPPTILNGCIWFTVDELTQAVTLNYQDSTGTLRTLLLGNYV
jgi:hypothetical protein